jgi:programmed cell death 8 (apoptosis-inducing factor)
LRNSVAKLDNGWEISFDKCLIATGGQPKSLKIFQTAANRVKSKLTLYRGVSLNLIFHFVNSTLE